MALLRHPHLHLYHYPRGLLFIVDLWFVVLPTKLVFIPQKFAPHMQ